MGRRKTGVNKLRDIIRYYTTDLSERQIGRTLKLSRTVVARTLRALRAIQDMPDSQVTAALE